MATELLGKTITIPIERLAHGGDGVAHYNGKTIFVPWSVPGDRLQVRVVEDKSRFARAEIVSIEAPGPKRVEPRCDVFGQCGGCQWQHIEYAAQVRFKEQIFRETLERMAHLKDPLIEPIMAADPPWEYRERIQLKTNQAGQVGFYAHKSHKLVPVEYCHISHPRLNQAIAEQRPVRADYEWVWEEATQQLSEEKSEWRVFDQVHRQQNQNLIKTVLTFLNPQANHRILELFCGNGNFSLPLGRLVARWFAIDQNAQAIGQAMRAAREAHLKQLEFLVGTAEWGLKKAQRASHTWDALLLDPPRGGVKELLDLIVMLKPAKLVYVSCDPASLARDLRFLTQHGYHLVRGRPLDMFPHTYHIEGVVELQHS